MVDLTIYLFVSQLYPKRPQSTMIRKITEVYPQLGEDRFPTGGVPEKRQWSPRVPQIETETPSLTGDSNLLSKRRPKPQILLLHTTKQSTKQTTKQKTPSVSQK